MEAIKRSASLQYVLLVLILLVAGLFRIYGLAWDGGYLFHPDERKIVMIVSGIHLPANPSEVFSPDSPLNPQFFAYGSFPIYLLRALGVFAPAAPFDVPWREDMVSLALLGRTLSTLFDLGTIVLIFLLARRLYDGWVGLIASACVAVTVLHIQLSHFYTVDTLLTFFVVATMFFAARLAQTGREREAVLTGVGFGLALATKISAAPLIVPIVMAVVRANHVKASLEEAEQSPKNLESTWRTYPGGQHQGKTLLAMTRQVARDWLAEIWNVRRALARLIGIALVAFIVTQPYALLDPIRYFGQTGTEWLVARGWLDYPYTRQYADTLPYIYPIAQSSVWGMGLPLGLVAWGGSAWFVWRYWRGREWHDGFILSWALVYFLIVGGQHAKYLRYLLPLFPFMFLMAGASLKSAASRFRLSISRFAFCAIFLIALLSGVVYAVAFVSMYSREHPWLEVSRWIYANAPADSTFAVEHWDDRLPVPMRGAGIDQVPTGYHFQTLPMYDSDDAAKQETIVNVLSDSDYVVLATQRLSATIMRLPHRYPMSSRYYRLLFSGELGFDLDAHAINGIALDGIVILDDRFDGALPPILRSDALVWNWGRADESFTVYDHPLPLVFKKTRVLSKDALRALLMPD